jgi:hypothetical protein
MPALPTLLPILATTRPPVAHVLTGSGIPWWAQAICVAVAAFGFQLAVRTKARRTRNAALGAVALGFGGLLALTAAVPAAPSAPGYRLLMTPTAALPSARPQP